MTKAEQIAELLGDDGMNFYADDGRHLDDVVKDFDAVVDTATVPQSYTPSYRYVFDDGSSIVVHGDAWDLEGDEPFLWVSS